VLLRKDKPRQHFCWLSMARLSNFVRMASGSPGARSRLSNLFAWSSWMRRIVPVATSICPFSENGSRRVRRPQKHCSHSQYAEYLTSSLLLVGMEQEAKAMKHREVWCDRRTNLVSKPSDQKTGRCPIIVTDLLQTYLFSVIEFLLSVALLRTCVDRFD